MTFKITQRIKETVKEITIEPIIFLYMWSTFQQYPTNQALIYKKTCMHKYNESICNNLTEKTLSEEEKYVESKSSTWIMYTNIAYTVPSIVTVLLLLGPWSDRIGRKIPVMVPIVGCIILHISNIINAVYMDLPIWCLIFGQFINGLSGGYIGIIMGVFSYIGDIVNKESRTVRIAVIEAMIFMAGTFGTLFSGMMLDNTSFVFAYSFLVCILGISLVYTIFILKDVKPEYIMDTTLCISIRRSLVDTCSCISKGSNRKNLLLIVLYILVVQILMLCTTGEFDILYLYVKLPKYDMSTTVLGYFLALNNFLRGVAVLTILPLMRYKFDVKDSTLILSGLLSKFVGLVILAVASEIWHIFAVAVISILQGFPSAAIRSSLSKLVNKDEQGKLFGLIASLESLSTFIGTIMFNKIYPASLDFFSGFCFLLAAFLTLIAFGIILFLRYRVQNRVSGGYNLREQVVNTEEFEGRKLN